jgi:hypothetical protein
LTLTDARGDFVDELTEIAEFIAFAKTAWARFLTVEHGTKELLKPMYRSRDAEGHEDPDCNDKGQQHPKRDGENFQGQLGYDRHQMCATYRKACSQFRKAEPHVHRLKHEPQCGQPDEYTDEL